LKKTPLPRPTARERSFVNAINMTLNQNFDLIAEQLKNIVVNAFGEQGRK
jgi:hypothetical protein